jgi:outer membrane receptor protein involved in Fe transport
MVPMLQTTETVFARPFVGSMLELTHRFTGSSESTYSTTHSNIIHLPSSSMFDAKATYQITSAWMAFVGVNNLADQKSMSGAYAQSFWQKNTIYPGEGRFIYLGSAYKF